ncbi:hypothetical protein [Methanobacterium formicicum]|uniref:Uncharacterized protein n=1 Tax=Methanobacterium formicicum TaxID=2162 RepID=A0A843AN24_METFO|nr:hypothetical protein [Methanobacterium formicicum]MBF4475248.1 hypothetical protein [Methanobacterium formicicum]
MNFNSYKKIYYIFLSFLIILFITSYEHVSTGGSFLYSNPFIFYLALPVVSTLLIYFLMNSKVINNVDVIMVFLLCMMMSLLFVLSVPIFPYGLDSIISVHSIDFTTLNGFSTSLLDQNLIFDATYSLPGLSILSSMLVWITELSSTKIAKLLPLLLTFIFFLIFYLFIYKNFDKKTSLISIILIYSFYSIITLGSQFANVVLAFPLVFLSWFLLFKRNKLRIIPIFILQILVVLTFVFTHHLTFLVFVLSLVFLQLFYYLSNKNNPNSIFVNFIVLSGVLMLAYYVYVYYGPLEIIGNSFIGQLTVEGKSATLPSSWNLSTVIQRLSWLVFLGFSSFFFYQEIKRDGLKNFLKMSYTPFLFVGGMLFLSSLLTLVVNAPFNFERISVFGWLFFIPATIHCFINSKKNFLKNLSFFFVCLLFIFGNISVIDSSNLDHSGDNEYSGQYKNWMKVQEYNSITWLSENNNINKQKIMGDDVSLRIYRSNRRKDIRFNAISLQDINKTNSVYIPNYIIIRKENFFTNVGGFYVNKEQTYEQSKISDDTYNKIINSNLIYNNNEVEIYRLFNN